MKALAWFFDHLPFLACVAVGIAAGVHGKPELGVGLLVLGCLTEIAGSISELRRDLAADRTARDEREGA